MPKYLAKLLFRPLSLYLCMFNMARGWAYKVFNMAAKILKRGKFSNLSLASIRF